VADWLGVPRHTFSRCSAPSLPAARTTGQCSSTSALASTSTPSVKPASKRPRRVPQRSRSLPRRAALLQALKDAGYFVGIAGNQTVRAGQFLRELNLPCDILATSDDWASPSPRSTSSRSSSRSAATHQTRSHTSATASTTTSAPPPPACSPSGSNAVHGATSCQAIRRLECKSTRSTKSPTPRLTHWNEAHRLDVSDQYATSSVPRL